MNVSTVVARATSGVGKSTAYASPGRMPSLDAATWPGKARTDCSGFVAWCLRMGVNRRVDHPFYRKVNGGWFETTAVHADGLASVGYFSKIDAARPGALLVYPDYIGADGARHDGHMGIVIDANGPGVEGVNHVVHCSLSASEHMHDAIQVTDAGPWRRSGSSIIVWLDGLNE